MKTNVDAASGLLAQIHKFQNNLKDLFMLSNSKKSILLLFVLTGLPALSQASSLSLSYIRYTTNNATNVAGQLKTTVMDNAGLTQYKASNPSYTSLNSLTLASDEVLFTFQNDIGTASAWSGVWFQDLSKTSTGATNSLLLSQKTILNNIWHNKL
ncbi:hypothetical protein [Methylosoma difficile]